MPVENSKWGKVAEFSRFNPISCCAKILDGNIYRGDISRAKREFWKRENIPVVSRPSFANSFVGSRRGVRRTFDGGPIDINKLVIKGHSQRRIRPRFNGSTVHRQSLLSARAKTRAPRAAIGFRLSIIERDVE